MARVVIELEVAGATPTLTDPHDVADQLLLTFDSYTGNDHRWPDLCPFHDYDNEATCDVRFISAEWKD